MAKGKKTGGRNFPKGYQGGGRKALPDDVRASRSMSYEDMCRTVIEIRNMTYGEALAVDKDMISLGKKAILNAYVKLDYQGMKFYEDRLWGKAQESIDLGIDATGNIEIIISAKQIEEKNDYQLSGINDDIIIPDEDDNENRD